MIEIRAFKVSVKNFGVQLIHFTSRVFSVIRKAVLVDFGAAVSAKCLSEMEMQLIISNIPSRASVRPFSRSGIPFREAPLPRSLKN